MIEHENITKWRQHVLLINSCNYQKIGRVFRFAWITGVKDTTITTALQYPTSTALKVKS